MKPKPATLATLKILSQYKEPVSLATLAKETGGLLETWRTVMARYQKKSWVSVETRYRDAEYPNRGKGCVTRTRVTERYFRLTELGLLMLEVKEEPPSAHLDPAMSAPLTDRRHIGSRPILNSVFNLSQFV